MVGARHSNYDPAHDGGITGLIPYGRVYPFKITYTGEETSTQAAMAEAIERAFAIREYAHAWVLNMSYGWRTEGMG